MNRLKSRRHGVAFSTITLALLLTAGTCTAQEAPPAPKGQRVFTAGHSFMMFVPNILRDIAQSAGIKDHVQVGTQSIGGSRVIQHWDRPDDQNQAKKALQTGKVDVLMLSPIFLPDEGITNFTKLALEHNPNIRINVQEFWLPFDRFHEAYPPRPRPARVDHNAITAEELRKQHDRYFKIMDEHIESINKQHGKQVLHVVPVGQAVVALREKIIAGQAPGLKTQQDLFTDAIGHATPPLRALVAYCHYAVIYRKSPVGLPVPAVLAGAKIAEADKLNRMLQELAWKAAVDHPLSGVKGE